MTVRDHINHLNQPMHAAFVSPVLCKDLMETGLTDKTPFHWKLKNGEAFIWSNSFDPDGYYDNAEELINQIYTTISIPAYTCADIEKLVGDFFHICKKGEHEVTAYHHTRIGTRRAPRYADALALIAIEILKRRIISPTVANNIITHI